MDAEPVPSWTLAAQNGQLGKREEQILRERARRLAEVPEAVRHSGTEMLLFQLREEQYAVELAKLHAIRRATELAPIPGVPGHVVGLVNIYGDIVTVVDLATVLGLRGAAAISADAYLLLVDSPHGLLGLLVDTIIGVFSIDLHNLDRSAADDAYVQGISEARMVVLDLDQIVRLDQLIVNDDGH